MRRRTVLAAVASGAATAAAGCTRLPEWSGEGSSGTTTAGPGVASASLTVTDSSCGEGADAASVSAGEDGDTVSISGTLPVPDGCHTAELDSAAVDGGTLRVVVAGVVREGVENCVQCLTDVAYDASVTVSGSRPERVVVVHESRDETREVASVDL